MMSIFFPWRVYLIASILVKEFDLNFRNRFAACLAVLSSEDEIAQDAFLDFLVQQDDTLGITKLDSKNLMRFERERYSVFLSSNIIRLDRTKSEVHELMFEYLTMGSVRLNKVIYIHNYINHPDFLYFAFFLNLIPYDDFRAAKYITKLSYGLTEVRDTVNYDYLKDFKIKFETKIYSLKSQLPIDVSQFDPIFTIATN